MRICQKWRMKLWCAENSIDNAFLEKNEVSHVLRKTTIATQLLFTKTVFVENCHKLIYCQFLKFYWLKNLLISSIICASQLAHLNRCDDKRYLTENHFWSDNEQILFTLYFLNKKLKWQKNGKTSCALNLTTYEYS